MEALSQSDSSLRVGRTATLRPEERGCWAARVSRLPLLAMVEVEEVVFELEAEVEEEEELRFDGPNGAFPAPLLPDGVGVLPPEPDALALLERSFLGVPLLPPPAPLPPSAGDRKATRIPNFSCACSIAPNSSLVRLVKS